MGKNNRKHKKVQVNAPKGPIYTPNQLKAYEYLLNDQCEPPKCDACKRETTLEEDVYEIFATGTCGFCQGWTRLPPEGKRYVITILNTPYGNNFLNTIQRILSIRPNAIKKEAL